MHFFKLIAAVVVVAATGVLASPYGEENLDLAGANHETEGLNGGMDATAFDSEMDFSPLGETSLESAMRGRCYWGRCLFRFSRHRRMCHRGYRVVGLQSCGWWSIRAMCCPWRRRWVHGDHEGDEKAIFESSDHQLDQLDQLDD